MNPRQAFGTALRKTRKERSYSQDELAFGAGLDRTYVSLLELGQRSPTLDTLQKLAAALGLQPSFLVLRMEAILKEKK